MFINSGYKSLIRYLIWLYFLPFCGLFFHFLDNVLWGTKFLNFDEVQFIFSFVTRFHVISKILLLNPKSQIPTPSSSSKFIALAFIFRSIIYYELDFMYGVRYKSHFIILHVDIQLSQNHLLEKLFILHWIVLVPL